MKKPAALETGLFSATLRQRSFAGQLPCRHGLRIFRLASMGKSQTLRHGSDAHKAFGFAGARMCMLRACFSRALLCKKDSVPKTPCGL